MKAKRIIRIFDELKDAYLNKEISASDFNLVWSTLLTAFKMEKEITHYKE